MNFSITNPNKYSVATHRKHHFIINCSYELTEQDGSKYSVVRQIDNGHAKRCHDVAAQRLINLYINPYEMMDRGLAPKTDKYKPVIAKTLLNGPVNAVTVQPNPLENTLQATMQQLVISQQAQAALQQEAAIAQQNLAAVQQQAALAQQQALIAQQNLIATQQQADLAQQQAAVLQQDLNTTQQHLALSNDEIANLRGQNLFLYSLIQEKDQELRLLLVDREANHQRIHLLEGQIGELCVLIRQFINSGR